MKSGTIVRAIIISIAVAVLTTVVTSILSATYVADPMGAEPRVVTGIEAISLWIGAAGISGVLKSHLGWFVSITISTFAACLVFQQWESKAGQA
jgi:hypothetical protein